MTEPSTHLPPPQGPAWDITYTRLMHAIQPRIKDFALALARRLQGMGLHHETSFRQTPRGLSCFTAVVGPRGLCCIVDITLVDGMAVCNGRNAWLDVRLLDACGDVVANGLLRSLHSDTLHQTATVHPNLGNTLDQAATTVYVAALAHFDLLQTAVPQT